MHANSNVEIIMPGYSIISCLDILSNFSLLHWCLTGEDKRCEKTSIKLFDRILIATSCNLATKPWKPWSWFSNNVFFFFSIIAGKLQISRSLTLIRAFPEQWLSCSWFKLYHYYNTNFCLPFSICSEAQRFLSAFIFFLFFFLRKSCLHVRGLLRGKVISNNELQNRACIPRQTIPVLPKTYYTYTFSFSQDRTAW